MWFIFIVFTSLRRQIPKPSQYLTLPGSVGSHRVGHNWSDLAAAAAAGSLKFPSFGYINVYSNIILMRVFSDTKYSNILCISYYCKILCFLYNFPIHGYCHFVFHEFFKFFVNPFAVSATANIFFHSGNLSLTSSVIFLLMFYLRKLTESHSVPPNSLQPHGL